VIVIFQQSINRILHLEITEKIGWVAVSSIIGNDLVAIFRINTGKRIGSAALLADGMHARADGLIWLRVLMGARGVWPGIPLAHPIIGFLIGVSMLVIVLGSARDMSFRLMDATEPESLDQIESLTRSTQGVPEVPNVRPTAYLFSSILEASYH
jgi:divalent metal cation (Fe/Co/Zn/Cd) transporter